MKLTALMLMLAIGVFGQARGALVTVTNYPTVAPSKFFDYDASGNVIYICYTSPNGPWNNNSVPASFSWTRTASTLTNIVDSSNTSTVTTSAAHGLSVGNEVVITGATVDTDLNGTYRIATVPSTTTFTITTSGVTDATYNESTLVVTTAAARLTVAIWTIDAFVYNASNQLINVMTAGGSRESYTKICANRASLTYR